MRLYFNGIPELSACASATFSWLYSGPSNEHLSLFITNEGVSQTPQPSASPVSELITSTADPSSESYTWSLVNVLPGWYKLNASLPQQSITVSSPVFYINSGATTSCLSSSSPSNTAGSHTNVGAIVGGALGVLAALILAAVLIFYLLRREKKLRSASASDSHPADRNRSLNSPFSPIKVWNHLASVDSHLAMGADASRQHSIHSAAHKSFTDSVNIPVLEYSHSHSRDISRTSLNGEEEKGSTSSSVDGVNNVLNTAQPHLDAYAVPEQAHTQNSRRQDKTYPTNLERANSAHSERRHKPSESSSLAASTASSLVTAAERASVYASASSTPAPVSRTDFAPKPALSVDDLSSYKPRKAARKPVPLYDPSADPTPSSAENVSPHSPTNANHPLFTDDPFARPTPVLATQSSSGTLNGISTPHYISRSQSMSRSQSNGGATRELVHKNSFGLEGRQMHYLMPDMPLPQKK